MRPYPPRGGHSRTCSPLDLPELPTCYRCGRAERVQGPGMGPHAAAEICGHCGAHFRWLAKRRTPNE